MPPETPRPDDLIAPAPQPIVKADHQGPSRPLTAFFRADQMSTAIVANDFDEQELYERMIHHIRDPDPKVSQKGIDQFLKHASSVVQHNGLTQRERLTQELTDAHGNKAQIESSRTSILDEAPDPGSTPTTGFHAPDEVGAGSPPAPKERDSLPEPDEASDGRSVLSGFLGEAGVHADSGPTPGREDDEPSHPEGPLPEDPPQR